MSIKRIPLIRAVFTLTKIDLDDFNRDKVTRLLRINPTETSGPTLSKGRVVCDPNIQEISNRLTGLTIISAIQPPYQMMKHAFWSIEMPKIECWGLDEPLQQLERIFLGKESELLHICNDYKLSAELIIRVFAESNDMPDLTLSSSSVSFWASIGASIGFDFYLD